MIQVDLSGSGGNAFALLGNAAQWGKDLGWSSAEVRRVTDKMMSGDYQNLCDTLQEYFGDYVQLVYE